MTPADLARHGTESGEQKALFCWAAMARLRGFEAAFNPQSYNEPIPPGSVGIPELQWLHASPNGGDRSARTAARMKAEGVKAGVLDIFLPVRRGSYSGLYIELKRLEKGRVSKEQQEFADFVIKQGYAVGFCKGWIAAAALIRQYFEMKGSS